MSDIARNTIADAVGDPRLPRRPSWIFSALVDGGFAVGAYLAAYWLRFYGGRLETFLPGAWSTLPLVVLMQLAALFAARAYERRPRVDWLLRVTAGVTIGTAAAGALIGVSMGFEGISRSAFLADAMLLSDRGPRLAGRLGSESTGKGPRRRPGVRRRPGRSQRGDDHAPGGRAATSTGTASCSRTSSSKTSS